MIDIGSDNYDDFSSSENEEDSFSDDTFSEDNYSDEASSNLLTLKSSLPFYNVTEDFKTKLPECAICFNDFMINEELPELPCKHYFHEQCLLQWFQITKSCPLCRKNIELEKMEWLLPEVCVYEETEWSTNWPDYTVPPNDFSDLSTNPPDNEFLLLQLYNLLRRYRGNWDYL